MHQPAQDDTVSVPAALPVNGFALLDALAALPVSTWRYRWEPEHVRHLGPMAQDWQAAFGLGDTHTTINMVDANGVAVVAIQALHHQVTELQQEIAILRAQLANLSPPTD
nr:hypothetical protein [Kibdelosporangium sp. MJ126-NF4]